MDKENNENEIFWAYAVERDTSDINSIIYDKMRETKNDIIREQVRAKFEEGSE